MQVKVCPHHRAQSRAQYASVAGQETRKAYMKTDAYKKTITERRATPVYKENQKRHAKTDKRKKKKAKMHQARVATPGGKMHHNIRSKISRMITEADYESTTVSMSTLIESKDALRMHFASLFEPGMSWDNYGLEDGTWQVGHRIARAMYDPSNPEDVKRCWSMRNMFPQWSRENRKAGVELPPEAELAELSAIFPCSWMGACPDNARRSKLECARVRV